MNSEALLKLIDIVKEMNNRIQYGQYAEDTHATRKEFDEKLESNKSMIE